MFLQFQHIVFLFLKETFPSILGGQGRGKLITPPSTCNFANFASQCLQSFLFSYPIVLVRRWPLLLDAFAYLH